MTVELPGRPGDLRWPDLCANCGAAAAERLPIAKAFVRRRLFTTRRADDPFRFAVVRFDVPFCGSCASRHHQLAVPLSPVRRVLTFLPSLYVIPVVLSAVGIWLFFDPFVLHAGQADLTIAPNPKQFAFLVFVLVLCGAILWYATRRRRLPPQTEITRAFDFDDWRGNVFSGRMRTYRIRSEAFASAFRTLNGS